MFSMIGLVLGGLAVVGVGLLVVYMFVGFGVSAAALPQVGKPVLLNCPHCGAETPSNLPDCRNCGRSFRDEVGQPPTDFVEQR